MNPSRQTRNTLLFLAMCMSLQMTGFVMILPLFARRFEDFGAGVEALGISAMAYALTSTLAAPWMGVLADRFGRRPIILFSLAAYVVAFSGYLFATSAWLLIVLRGLAGIFTSGLVPTIISIVGDLTPEECRAKWIGIVNGGSSAGWIIGPLLGGLLYDHFGYGVPLTVSVTLATGALLLAVFQIPETQPTHNRPAREHPGSKMLKALHISPFPSLLTFPLLLMICFGVMFVWAFIEPQFMFYAYNNLRWTSSHLGLVMSTYGIALTFGEFALGPLSDRLGRKPVLVLGLILYSAQFIGLAFFHEAIAIAACFVLAGLGNALYDPAVSAHILDITPSEYKARIMGLKSTAGSLGSMLGPALVVLFTPIFSPRVVFLIATTLVFLLVFASGFVLRETNTLESTQYST